MSNSPLLPSVFTGPSSLGNISGEGRSELGKDGSTVGGSENTTSFQSIFSSTRSYGAAKGIGDKNIENGAMSGKSVSGDGAQDLGTGETPLIMSNASFLAGDNANGAFVFGGVTKNVNDFIQGNSPSIDDGSFTQTTLAPLVTEVVNDGVELGADHPLVFLPDAVLSDDWSILGEAPLPLESTGVLNENGHSLWPRGLQQSSALHYSYANSGQVTGELQPNSGDSSLFENASVNTQLLDFANANSNTNDLTGADADASYFISRFGSKALTFSDSAHQGLKTDTKGGDLNLGGLTFEPENGSSSTAATANLSNASKGALQTSIPGVYQAQSPSSEVLSELTFDLESGATELAIEDMGAIMEEGGLKRLESFRSEFSNSPFGVRTADQLMFQNIDRRGLIPAQIHFSHPNWSGTMAEKAAAMVSQNISSADIQLDPPELGPLQVRVQVHQDQASVTFVSANPLVREALDLSMVKLREMLSEQGLDLVDSGVSDQQSGAEGGDRDQGKTNESGNGPYVSSDDGLGSADGEVMDASVTSQWGIDHFV